MAKRKKRLLTSSLVSGIRWAKNCPASWKKKAFQDLNNTLARVWSEPNEAAALGIKLEKWVYKILESKIHPDDIKSSKMFKEIICRYYSHPFEIQKKVKRFITIDKNEYCLYGKLDLCSEKYIEDIKTTSKIMSSSDYAFKYLNSFQHHLYCYITEIPDFQYFIVVLDEGKIRETHEIEYHSSGMDIERNIIEEAIREVFTFFGEFPSLLELYGEKYCLY